MTKSRLQLQIVTVPTTSILRTVLRTPPAPPTGHLRLTPSLNISRSLAVHWSYICRAAERSPPTTETNITQLAKYLKRPVEADHQFNSGYLTKSA